MKSVLLLFIFSLAISIVNAQFDFDNLIHETESSIEFIYKEFNSESDSIFCEVKHLEGASIVLLRNYKKEYLECAPSNKGLEYYIEFKYDSLLNSCNFISVKSNCDFCSDNMLSTFLINSSYRKWIKVSKNTYISTKSNGWIKELGGKKAMLYYEVNFYNKNLIIVSKKMEKSKWKNYAKTLKKGSNA